ncbi:dTMP kinase [bacterium]|nr:dTMP kinase [bacterium]
MQGRLISFEGLDGVGKSTQVELLREVLAARNLTVQCFREPGGTQAGEELRTMIKLGRFETALAELLAFETARAELVGSRIRPALERGEIVILDRFADSSLAYQGALGKIPAETIRQLNQIATAGLQPDLTIWLALDPRQALERRTGAEKPAAGGGQAESTDLDHIEKRELDYFRKVHDIFNMIMNEDGERFLRFDAALHIEAVHRSVSDSVLGRLKEWGWPT